MNTQANGIDPYAGIHVYDAEGEPHGVTYESYDALVGGCNAVLGLIQLISHRNDLTPELRAVLANNHRVQEAEDALNYARGAK